LENAPKLQLEKGKNMKNPPKGIKELPATKTPVNIAYTVKVLKANN